MSASAPRIVSLLPSATEMVCALGLEKQLVAVSHSCDFPPAVRSKPVATRSMLPPNLGMFEIDAEVTRRLRNGESLYEVDEDVLRGLEPDLLVTQDLCEVCAVSPKDLTAILARLANPPRVVGLTPKSLEGIFENLRHLGELTDRRDRADALIEQARARLAAVNAKARQLPDRPRVFCMEWIDPPYCCGHWVPEMIELAGGVDALARHGTDSVRVTWQHICDWAPEVLIVMPCGFDLGNTASLAACLPAQPGWADIPAVRAGRVFAVDANSYFARPGPRVVDGTELLAHLIHPDAFDWKGPSDAFVRLRTDGLASGDTMTTGTAAPDVAAGVRSRSGLF